MGNMIIIIAVVVVVVVLNSCDVFTGKRRIIISYLHRTYTRKLKRVVDNVGSV